MKKVLIGRQKKLRLTTPLPGDKSISHRSMMFAGLATGKSKIKNYLESEDCLSTLEIFSKLGAKVQKLKDGSLVVEGVGQKGLQAPTKELYCGNSGTTMRLMSGILSGQNFACTLTGDPSLSKRPMDRISKPLSLMGARISGNGGRIFAPLKIEGQKLKGISYTLPVASAQVKSSILLAGLFADGTTTVVENIPTRDHTERFLKFTGCDFKKIKNHLKVTAKKKPKAFQITVPGDVSSAAFLIAIGILVPDSKIVLKEVLFNPERIGLIQVLKRMGAKIKILKTKLSGAEKVADLEITTSYLKATEVLKKEVPSLIDELPILMVIATQARGKTILHDVEELRVKETDRVESMVTQLKVMGANIIAKGNRVEIVGPTPLHASRIQSFGDHRTAMSFIVAGMIAQGENEVDDIENINTSFPNFFELIKKAGVRFKIS